MKPSWTQRLEERALARGRAEGIAWSILALLQKRGLPITEEQRLALSHCKELDQLGVWLLRAAEVSSVSELLPQPSRQSEEDAADEIALAEARVEEVYRTLEALLSQRVAGHTEPALEAEIEAHFKALAQRKQERSEAFERDYQSQGATPLDELKEALAEGFCPRSTLTATFVLLL